MKRLLLATACWLVLLLADSAAAGQPYLVLGRQQQTASVQPLHAQGYAYGWFGASARPQAERQTGYYGLYRQWRIK